MATGWVNTGEVKDRYFDECGNYDDTKYQKLVALTYDDGPSESGTPKVLDALEKYGVDHIYTEQMSGVKQRPVLEGVLSELNAGDTLVVWKLDRLGRTSKELVNMIDDFERRGINFVSITEQFDTTTPTGKFVVTMFIAMAQLERDVIVMRTKAGLKKKKKRGRIGGRPKVPQDRIEYALLLHNQGSRSVKYICEKAQISRSTLYRILKEKKEKEGNKHEDQV